MAENVQFTTESGGIVRIQPLSPHSFRIRIGEAGGFNEPALSRYGITSDRLGNSGPEFSSYNDGHYVIIETAQAVLRADRRDGSVSLLNKQRDVLIESACPPWSGRSQGFGAAFQLKDEEQLYGLGDQPGENLQRKGSSAVMRVSRSRPYLPIPFLMSSRGWALYIHTTETHTIDAGHTDPGILCFRGEQGELDYYLFTGDSYGELLDRYTDIAGKPALLPIWAYGLTFSCNQYANAREVIEDALNFRREDIPCDLIGLEPGWMETWYDYSTGKRWHPERFSIPSWTPKGPRTFMGTLERLGFKYSLWLCCSYDLSEYEERLLAEREGITYEQGQEEAWYDHLRKFVEQGASAFKLEGDFVEESHTGPFANGMSPKQMHNLHQLLLCKQMYAGYRAQTGQRPMLYSMSGYAGIQQYAASWAGYSGEGEHDKALSWLQNCAMSGHVNAVCDMDVFSPAGIHFGFLQTLSQVNSFAYWQHPSLLDRELHEMFRMYAKLRYSLLPYLYTAAHAASQSGMPVLRPMPLCFPDDPHSASLVRQYMLGDALLVSAFTNIVYLPDGKWIDYWTGERHDGPKTLTCSIPNFAGGPLFVRAGSIIPTWPEGSRADRQIPADIGLHFYVHEASDFTLYEDDGRTFDYVEGKCSLTRIRCRTDKNQADISIAARLGRFDGMPERRIYNINVHAEAKPFGIRLDGVVLPELNRLPANPAEGWYFDRNTWQIRLCVEEARSASQAIHIELRFDATERRGVVRTLQDAEHTTKKRTANSAYQGGQAYEADPGTPSPAALYTLEHELEIGLLSGDAHVLFAAFERYWNDMMERNGPQSEVRERLLSLVGLFVRIGERLGCRLTEIVGEHYVRFMKLPELASPDEARLLVGAVIQQFLDYRQQIKSVRASDLVRQTIALIEGETEHELTLKYAAERLHVNSSHLSRLFKRETGIAFSDYVLNHKMERAKHMLLDNQKIGSVASALGYKDSSHFIRVFRNYWGLTPGELRGRPSSGGRISPDSNRA